MSNIERLKDAGIAHLEMVFQPEGLPLPVKVPGQPGTTSILVRGAPGTGKTTIAVALANRIAASHEGVVLYLGTEFVTTEVQIKAELLGIPAVRSWEERAGAESGGIVVVPVQLALPAGAPQDDPRDEALTVAWEKVATHGGEGRPVRAVVVDAFGLGQAPLPGLRDRTLGCILGLEQQGIAVILVAEAGVGEEAWLPFVTDMVFETGHVMDEDVGKLRRVLTLAKCRYGFSLPGPHRMGVDQAGRIGVWPDVLDVSRLSLSGKPLLVRRTLFIYDSIRPPPAQEKEEIKTGFLVFARQGVFLSAFLAAASHGHLLETFICDFETPLSATIAKVFDGNTNTKRDETPVPIAFDHFSELGLPIWRITSRVPAVIVLSKIDILHLEFHQPLYRLCVALQQHGHVVVVTARYDDKEEDSIRWRRWADVEL